MNIISGAGSGSSAKSGAIIEKIYEIILSNPNIDALTFVGKASYAAKNTEL